MVQFEAQSTMDGPARRGDNQFVSKGELRFDTTIGTLEVWITSSGETRIYVLGGDDRATSMVGDLARSVSELAVLFVALGLSDQEADSYANEIWKIASPKPDHGFKARIWNRTLKEGTLPVDNTPPGQYWAP
jgi:hypothetical protein